MNTPSETFYNAQDFLLSASDVHFLDDMPCGSAAGILDASEARQRQSQAAAQLMCDSRIPPNGLGYVSDLGNPSTSSAEMRDRMKRLSQFVTFVWDR